MANILMTLAEEKTATTPFHFAVKYKVDEYDCFDFSNGLKELGHDVFFANWDDLSAKEFTRMFHDNSKRFVSPVRLSEMDLIFVYKMEGFYYDLPRFFSMIDTFESACSTIVNHPATIRHNLDKRYLWELEKAGINIVPTYPVNCEIKERIARGERIVCKPIRGERGQRVTLVRSLSEFAPIEVRSNQFLAQDFVPGIRNGERSLVYLGHEYQHAVIKRPSATDLNEFRCNESLGGTAHEYEPSSSEIEFAGKVLCAYESLGFQIHYSRIDVIETDNGLVLGEAELINPSIFANYVKRGPEFGRKIARYFHNMVAPQAAGAH